MKIPNRPSAVRTSDIIDYLTGGEYESGHWLQRALASYPPNDIPSAIIADIENLMHKASGTLESEINGESVKLYRGMRQASANGRPIGAHWTVDFEIATGFGEFVYSVDAKLEDIDWVATVSRRMAWPNEREVAVKGEGRQLEHRVEAHSSTRYPGHSQAFEPDSSDDLGPSNLRQKLALR